MKHVFAVIFFDRQFTRKPHTHRPRHANRAERFVRKIQEQNSTRYQWNHLLKLLCYLMNSIQIKMQSLYMVQVFNNSHYINRFPLVLYMNFL